MDGHTLERLTGLVEHAGGHTKQQYMILVNKFASDAADAFDKGESQYIVDKSEFRGYQFALIIKLLIENYPLCAYNDIAGHIFIKLSDYEGTLLL